MTAKKKKQQPAGTATYLALKARQAARSEAVADKATKAETPPKATEKEQDGAAGG